MSIAEMIFWACVIGLVLCLILATRCDDHEDRH